MKNSVSEPQLYEINGRQYNCPFELTTSVLMSKWKIKLIKLLCDNEKLRYNELKKSVQGEITHKMLTQSLRELESDGIVIRRVYREIPPRVEYSLTKTGKSLQPVIEAMITFGIQFIKKEPVQKRQSTSESARATI